MSGTAPGRRRPQPYRVTLAEVAARAHVDPSVVSKVVNDDPSLSIRPETRRRVVAAVRETGYRPNALARSLRGARTGMLGLFVSDFADPDCARVVKGAEAASTALGILLVAGSAAGPGFRGYLDLLGGGRVDGLLVAASGTGVGAGELARLGMPWLVLGRLAGPVRRYVALDYRRAAALATEHLAALGHRRIVHLPGPRGDERRTRALLRRADRPTAVLAPDVVTAARTLDAARSAGLSVPGELSVVALRDGPSANLSTPPVTATRVPYERLGRRGVELLTHGDTGAPVHELLGDGFALVERGSTAPPPRLP